MDGEAPALKMTRSSNLQFVEREQSISKESAIAISLQNAETVLL